MIYKKKLIDRCILLLALFLSAEVEAESWTHQTSGYLSSKIGSYTENRYRNLSQFFKAQIEENIDFKNNLSSLNQLRWNSNSFDFDVNKNNTSNKKNTFSTFLGENYIKYKADNWVTQVGYQEVVWGEAFGFNYADIINPKDLKQTFFNEAPESRLPLLLINTKTFFSFGELVGSIQLLYSPEPKFSKALPIDLLAGNLFPNQTLSVNEEKNPNIFDNNEFGGKIAASYRGFDLGLFTYKYLDRAPYYTLESATLTNLSINEVHNRIRSSGISIAKTISDFVFRSDIVYSQNKKFNNISNFQLKSYTTNTIDSLISLDSPTYENFSGVLIFANSNLTNSAPYSFREQKEQYLIGKITRNLEKEKSIELSYVQDLKQGGKSLQSFLSWPVNSSTDLKIGGEFYFGNEASNLYRLKNVSNVFLSLKNYFQL